VIPVAGSPIPPIVILLVWCLISSVHGCPDPAREILERRVQSPLISAQHHLLEHIARGIRVWF
jgi:hypothetical protein